MFKLGIVVGDPAGIGPEVVLKALSRFRDEPILVIGSYPILERVRDSLGLGLDLDNLVYDAVPDFKFSYGRAQASCGRASYKALITGLELLKARRIRGLVTAPISKTAWRLARVPYPGHTELLAQFAHIKRYAMLAYTEPLKVVFATIHEPLARVPGLITPARIVEKAQLLHQFLRLGMGIEEPRIGVLALNPHGKEFSLGEETKISRAVHRLNRDGIRASGPLPADGLGSFMREYDGFVAMYHDQGMIPAKLCSQAGVNLTLGLPFVRTAPLHGTAFDRAGKGVASSAGMEAAIELGLKLLDSPLYRGGITSTKPMP